jgi:predicted ATP-grasp superfamily ATP-dependent carboligase
MSQALHKMGCVVHAVVDSKLSYGYGSRYIDKKYIYKEINNISLFYDYVISLLKREHYDVMIPMHDESAEMVSTYRDELLKYTHFVMPSLDVFRNGYDKQKLMKLLENKSYPHPKTVFVEQDVIDDDVLDKVDFPLLIKPNTTSGARGMARCGNVDELRQRFPLVCRQFGACHLQSIVKAGGHQVEVQLYVNGKGELVQSSVIKKFRWYPVNGGSSSCCVSEYNKKIVETCYQVLKDLGWEGFADFDTIEDPETGELLIMELNPRLPACVRAAFEGGVNWADVILNEYLGQDHKIYHQQEGKYLRFLGFEMLWFVKSRNRWGTKPNWFKFLGKDIYYQDIMSNDMWPFVLGTIGNIKKLLSSDFRKAKAGN